jgi:hypothetical protein
MSSTEGLEPELAQSMPASACEGPTGDVQADDPGIPDRLDEITPAWLTAVLRTRGHLGHASVRSIDQEILGDGQGFMGAIARLSLAFDGDPGNAPRTLIAKLPTPVEQNRVMGEVLGSYWREIHFYEELSAMMPVRVPRVYYADLTPDPMREKQDQLVRLLDRLPAWILKLLMYASGWLAGRNAHRYVLLLEDLAPARVGDQVAGGSNESCAQVLRTAAQLHAAFWQSPVLDEKFWLARQASGPRTRQRMFRSAVGDFRVRHGSMLGVEDLEMLDWLDRHGEAIGRALHDEPPATLLHGDFRLDNIFFDDARTVDEARTFDEARTTEPVILADWQLAGVGAAGYDVAYLLSGSLAADVTAEEEHALLAGYHHALCEGGVAGYSLQDFRRDYQRGLFSVLQVLATTGEVDMGDARGVTLMDRWIERTLTLLRRVDRDALLPAPVARRRRAA